MTPQAEILSKLLEERPGDEALEATSLDWVILRPSVVVGRQAYGGSALFRGLAALPLLPVPAGNTGLQMAGWFRKPIESLASLQGLKIRLQPLDTESTEAYIKHRLKLSGARRMPFTLAMNGASESGRSQSRDLTSYFSEKRYSSLVSAAGSSGTSRTMRSASATSSVARARRSSSWSP